MRRRIPGAFEAQSRSRLGHKRDGQAEAESVSIAGLVSMSARRIYGLLAALAWSSLTACAADGVPGDGLTRLLPPSSTLELTPPFDPSVHAYTASVPTHVDAVEISPLAADEAASLTVSVDSMPVDPDEGRFRLGLVVGANRIIVVVTAGGDARTYSLVVTRTPPDAPAGVFDISGTIIVADRSYWPRLRVGVLRKLGLAGVQTAVTAAGPSDLTLRRNVFFADRLAAATVELEVRTSALDPPTGLAATYALPLARDVPDGAGDLIVAWLDDDGDGKWDARNDTTAGGVAGTEYIRLPIKASAVVTMAGAPAPVSDCVVAETYRWNPSTVYLVMGCTAADGTAWYSELNQPETQLGAGLDFAFTTDAY